MERNEPSLVPEWLRTNGGGIGGGGSVHHFASSHADGPVLASPRGTYSKNNYDSLHSSRVDRSSSSNSRRSLNSYGFSKHEKNSYARSYSSFSRGNRDRDSEKSTISDSWNLEYSDPLKGLVSRREDSLRRSQSLISKRPAEGSQRRVPTDLNNCVLKNHDNGTHSIGGTVTNIHKVSFERDFPALVSEERPKTPDVIRVSSPGLSRGVQSFPTGNPPSAGNGVVGPVTASQPATTFSASCSSSASVSASPSSSLNMAAALVQAPMQSLNSPQLQKDDLAIAQCKKLIPVTPSLPKTTILSSSDKWKPKTATRSGEVTATPKNGVHPLSPLQHGSQPLCGATVRGDDPKSPSAGKLLLLKPGREINITPNLKDLQNPANNHNDRVTNGQSTTSHNQKSLPIERKASVNGLNPGVVVDKRTSRNNFFKLMREKSLNNTSAADGSCVSSSVEAVDKLDNEVKESSCTRVTPAETESEVKCNGETCADDLSPSVEIDNEEERAFLLSLGWVDNDEDEDDEEGLTKEEIEAFYKEVMRQGATSRVCRLLEAKLLSHVSFSSNEPNTSVPQTGA